MRGHQERIKLTDNVFSIVAKLSDNNPGAIVVLGQLLKDGAKIDPDCGGGEPIFMLLNIDSYGIYGSRLWMLYKDVCGENITKTWACIRATQLGIISDEVLDFAIDNGGHGLNLEDVCRQVKEQLPNFQFEV